jgi:deoxyribodipyrimidine photolyase-related protein
MKIFIILPTQLFEDNNYLSEMDMIIIIEEPFYFTSKKFHKQKLVLHRASMKYYYEKIKNKYQDKNIKYLEYDKINYNEVFKNNDIYIFDPIDKPIIKKFKTFSSQITIIDTPSFLETLADLEEYRNKYTNKKNYYHDRSFYKWQRKRLNLLMNGDKPLGDKWSFDKENRNKYDDGYKEPEIKIYNNKYLTEAKKYINKNFKNNFGLIDNFYYPITYEETIEHLNNFIKVKLGTFGKYQDGISKKVIFGSHSILSPMLNIGLITPKIIIKEVIKYLTPNNLKSIEAFIRQLIGWRSYVRFIYNYHGEEMMKMNYFNHKNKLPKSWYNETGNITIINDMIIKVKTYAYLHHIERLMILGNYGLLLQIDPNEIYEWFMICFIDSYEWVMVPNIYGMSQYSLTSISMMTRPYISSSNYIKKMSNYKKEDWFNKWDAIYWYFIYKHKDLLKKIYSIQTQVKLLEKMEKTKLDNYIKISQEILNY